MSHDQVLDVDKVTLCRNCLFRGLVTDRQSADVVCSKCGFIWGKWSPEHPDNARPAPPSYTRDSYFDVVLGNVMGFNCARFTSKELSRVRDAAPEERDWDVGKVRAITRKHKMKTLTKSAGRMAHCLRHGTVAKYPKLHHVEVESMKAMFGHVWGTFEELGAKSRKNLISYSFVIGKLLGVIGRYDDFRHLIVPIKTRSKLRFAEAVWKEVVRDAPWNLRVDRFDNNDCETYLKSVTYPGCPEKTSGAPPSR